MLANPIASDPPAKASSPTRPRNNIEMMEREYINKPVKTIGNAMFEMCLASLMAREKWVFFVWVSCCLNVGDLGINGVNMSGFLSLVVDMFVWLLLVSHKVETEELDDDNWHMV